MVIGLSHFTLTCIISLALTLGILVVRALVVRSFLMVRFSGVLGYPRSLGGSFHALAWDRERQCWWWW
jgi:hypothetical protein